MLPVASKSGVAPALRDSRRSPKSVVAAKGRVGFICVHPWLKDFSTVWIRLKRELQHVHIILSFGRSCESTKPTSLRFVFTTMRLSMFQSVKIFIVSEAALWFVAVENVGEVCFDPDEAEN